MENHRPGILIKEALQVGISQRCMRDVCVFFEGELGGKYIWLMYSQFCVRNPLWEIKDFQYVATAEEVPVPDFKDMEGQIVKAEWREVGFRQLGPGNTDGWAWSPAWSAW